MANIKKEDWINCAITELKLHGHQAISPSKLATCLGVTRGSFYHHFQSSSAFSRAVLLEWVSRNTEQGFDSAEKNSLTEVEKLEKVMEFAWSSDAELEVAVREWATVSEEAKQCVAKTDEKRLSELTRLYQSVAKSEQKGSSMAKIAFYGLRGALHSNPPLSQDELQSLILEIQNFMLSSL